MSSSRRTCASVGIDVEFEVLDWEALRNRRRLGAAAPENRDRHGLNSSWAYWDPDIGLIGPGSTIMKTSGFNWGNYTNPEAEKLAKAAKETFDPQEQDKLLARLHEVIVDDAAWVWAVHDLNPRALGPNVRGFVQAESWFQDLTPARCAVANRGGLAGAPGFEPGNGGIKILCLTTWLRPKDPGLSGPEHKGFGGGATPRPIR